MRWISVMSSVVFCSVVASGFMIAARIRHYSESMKRANKVPSPMLVFLNERRTKMVEVLRQLVEQESPSFNKPAVDAFAQSLGKMLAGMGARVQFHPARQFGDHLQADFVADNSAKPVLLLGHMDTV